MSKKGEIDKKAFDPSTTSVGFVKWGFVLAFYCLARDLLYEEAISIVLALGGDTDTNCCIVGGLIGAKIGRSQLPAP